MKEAYLYMEMEEGKVACGVCPRHCMIPENFVGFCRMYVNLKGTLYSLNYGKISSYTMDPIEKKPLYHFAPGTDVFSVGTWGCNFHCKGCQNSAIACIDRAEESVEMTPEELVEAALEENAKGIAFTYNEPTVSFEYTLDTFKLAHEKGLYTVYVTNGFQSSSALRMISPYLDVYRVDIKAFKEESFKFQTGMSQYAAVLKNAIQAKHNYGMHVEVVTNLIPKVNDTDEELSELAEWIARELGTDTPWHVTRFFPRNKMLAHDSTPFATIKRAYDIGKKAGLEYVYAGNIDERFASDTVCPGCGATVIERIGYRVRRFGIEDGKCRACGHDLNIRSGLKNTDHSKSFIAP